MKKDTVAPTDVTGKVTKTMINSITVEANGKDDLSGLYGFGYKYKITSDRDYKISAEAQKAETLPYTYKYRDLKSGQTYKLQIIAYDKAGNTSEIELEQKTKDLAIGEYVDYTPDYGEYVVKGEYSGYQVDGVLTDQVFRTEELEWRIFDFDIETDKLVLFATSRLTKFGPTNDGSIYLTGYTGFNNFVKIFNDLCKECYSNKSLNASAKAISVDDLIITGDWEYKDTFEFTGNLINEAGWNKYYSHYKKLIPKILSFDKKYSTLFENPSKPFYGLSEQPTWVNRV